MGSNYYGTKGFYFSQQHIMLLQRPCRFLSLDHLNVIPLSSDDSYDMRYQVRFLIDGIISKLFILILFDYYQRITVLWKRMSTEKECFIALCSHNTRFVLLFTFDLRSDLNCPLFSVLTSRKIYWSTGELLLQSMNLKLPL